MSPILVLVGAPGSGKSTVGRLVADQLGVAFRDSDADIEAAAGQKISDIFVENGEPHFRALEKAAVKEALSTHDGVLALGGGAILDADTRVLLKEHRVVFLEVTLTDAAARVGLNRERPLLLGNVRGTLLKLMDERRPFYEEVAVLTVRTDREPEEVAADIVDSLKQ